MKISISDLTHEDLVSILCTALEGNQYFAASYKKSDWKKAKKTDLRGETVYFEDKLADILLSGMKIELIDLYAEGQVHGDCLKHIKHKDGSVSYFASLADFELGLSHKDALEYLYHIQTGQDDMWDGYNLIQLVMFDEIIYG